jgi:transposase-like protein
MPRPRKDYDAAVKLYESGASVSEVAREFGVSRQNMWVVLKRRGCKIRPVGGV